MSGNATGRLPILVNLTTQERFKLDGPSFKIGRAPDNEIVLPDDGYVSAEHARIFWDAGWWLEDLMSSNGTMVNDQLVTTPQKLLPNDEIKIGRTLFRIE